MIKYLLTPAKNTDEREVVLIHGRIVIIACFLIAVLAYGCIYSFGVFFKSLREDLGWSAAATSGVFSLYLLSYCCFGTINGWIVDRFGPKIAITIGGVFIGSGFLLTSYVYKLWHMYVCYGLLVGIGMSAIYGPLLVTTSRWIHKRRGLALGIVSSGIGVGNVLLPFLASHLILQYGWRTSYFIMGSLAGGGIVILAILLLKKDPSFRKYMQSNSELNVEGKNIVGNYPMAKIFFMQVFWLFAIVYLMVGFGLQMIILHIVPYIIKMFKASPVVAAGVFSIMGASSIIGRLSMGVISDYIGRKQSLIICVLLESLAILTFINITNVYSPYIFAILFGFGFGGHTPQFPGLTGELFGLDKMGSIIGLYQIFYGVGGAFGSFLAGVVLDRTGSYNNAFVLAGIAMLLAAASSLKLRRPILC